MNNKYWFRNRTFGYGVVPASWQGWLTMILYVAVMGAGMQFFPPAQYTGWVLIPFVAVPTAIFWTVLSRKSEPARFPRWPWNSKRCKCSRCQCKGKK